MSACAICGKTYEFSGTSADGASCVSWFRYGPGGPSPVVFCAIAACFDLALDRACAKPITLVPGKVEAFPKDPRDDLLELAKLTTLALAESLKLSATILEIQVKK